MDFDVSIAVLCGGKSTRFGSDKAVHLVGGKPMYRHVLDKLSGLSDDLFMQVAKDNTSIEGNVKEDLVPAMGPLGGIFSALSHATHDRVFVVACDMPFLDPRIFNELVMAGDADIVVPRWRDGRTEPLCAIYAKTVTPIARRLLDGGQTRVAGLFHRVEGTVYLPIDELIEQGRLNRDCFFNINEPKDLQSR